MEPLLILFGLALLAGILLGPIFGFIAWLTSRENRRQLQLVQGQSLELQQLQCKVSALEQRYEAGVSEAPAQAPKEQSAPVEIRVEAPAAKVIEESPFGTGSPGTTESPEAEVPVSPADLPPLESLEAKPETTSLGEDIPEGTSFPEPAAEEGEPPSLPPTEPPPASPGPPAKGPEAAKIDWERWVGLRGAAVLGGVVFALAALLFLQYSIETGLIPPVVRVALAVFAGLGALGGSLTLRKRGYETTANALAGAGIVILYGAIWAAKALYGLVGAGIAYPLMVLVTVVCGLYSWRFRTLVVAVLGLFGGFATPALLSSGSNNPIGLFGYLLLLNVGLLVLARKRGWPSLALLSVVVTGLYQGGWILDRMRGDDAFLALVVLGVFALLFTLGTARLPVTGEPGQRLRGLPPWLGGGGAVSTAFALSLHLSGRADFEGKLLPLVGLLALLSVAALWLGRVHRAKWIPLAAAGVSVASLFNWLQSHRWGNGQEWQAVGATLGLALAFHLFQEWDRRRSPSDEESASPSWAPSLATFGFLLVLEIPAWLAQNHQIWPWVLGWIILAGLLVRQSMVKGLASAQAASAVGLGLGAFALLANGGGRGSAAVLPSPELFLAATLAACLGFQILGLRRQEPANRWADLGAGLLPLLALGGFLLTRDQAYRFPLIFLGGSLVLALFMVLAATRQRSGLGYAGTALALAFVHWSWARDLYRLQLDRPQSLLALGLLFLAAVFLTFWPILAGKAFAKKRWAWYGAALAGPAWFFSIGSVYEDTLGEGTLGVVPLVLAGLSLFAAIRTRDLWKTQDPMRKSSLVWFAAIALGFVSLAIPLQLEKEWVTVGWALQGLATLALWKRLDHPGLKYFSLALLAAISIRLLVNPAVLGYHQASGVPVFNWLTYTYLVPAACLLGGAYFLFRREVELQRPWERALYTQGRSVMAGICGLTAILVIFAWINLSIVDFFSAGSKLTLTFERAAARDLTTSLAWGIFAVLLLAIGIAKGWAGLRWISLAFLVLTIGKVFLYDLGELEDLYRVASLVGLAVSLILVSLVYQRFVFRREGSE